MSAMDRLVDLVSTRGCKMMMIHDEKYGEGLRWTVSVVDPGEAFPNLEHGTTPYEAAARAADGIIARQPSTKENDDG